MGGVAALVLLGFVAFIIRRRRKTKQDRPAELGGDAYERSLYSQHQSGDPTELVEQRYKPSPFSDSTSGPPSELPGAGRMRHEMPG